MGKYSSLRGKPNSDVTSVVTSYFLPANTCLDEALPPCTESKMTPVSKEDLPNGPLMTKLELLDLLTQMETNITVTLIDKLTALLQPIQQQIAEIQT